MLELLKQMRFLTQTLQWPLLKKKKSQSVEIKQQVDTLGNRLTLLQTPTGALALPSKYQLPTLSLSINFKAGHRTPTKQRGTEIKQKVTS